MIKLTDPRVVKLARKYGYNLTDARKIFLRSLRSFTWAEWQQIKGELV